MRRALPPEERRIRNGAGFSNTAPIHTAPARKYGSLRFNLTMKRTAFFLSDRTGITAETLAHSLLTQFEGNGVSFDKVSCPYLDTQEKAHEVVRRICDAEKRDGARPLLFSTLIDAEIREIVASSGGLLIDFFDAFILPLEAELGIHSTHAVGRSHGVGSYSTYKARIDAVNFALANDDGMTTRNYPDADVILVGVSRSGKTPTCLYLALQYGILAANYPLADADFESSQLPEPLVPHRKKLYGLTINPDRLQQIRNERRPDSRYATATQCQFEVRAAERLFQHANVRVSDTSVMSIEEIATTIMHQSGLERRLYG
jgi:[pyruvate, water dikinase]-phosphate phosphotransferase / [pyruvate, water dikinase] kinase